MMDMKQYLMIFLLGAIALLLAGCMSAGNGAKAQPTAQPTPTSSAHGQTNLPTTLPTGPRLCVMEQPSTRTVTTYYDDGAERMRIENKVGAETLITVLKDGYSLSRVSEESPLKERYPNCDWVANRVSIESIRGGMISVAQIYKDEPGFRLTCTPWVVDDKMFETPGKVCLGS